MMDQDPAYIGLYEIQCEQLAECVRLAGKDVERELLVGFLIQYLNFLVHRYTPLQCLAQEGTDVEWAQCHAALLMATHLLHEPILREPVFSWLEGLVDEAKGDESQQGTLTIVAFEPMLTGNGEDLCNSPIDLGDLIQMYRLDRIFNWYQREDRRWVVYEAYCNRPARCLLHDLEIYNRWRVANGKQPLDYDPDVVRQWFDKFGGWDDEFESE